MHLLGVFWATPTVTLKYIWRKRKCPEVDYTSEFLAKIKVFWNTMRYFTSCLQNGTFLPVEINTGENDTSVYASQKNAWVRLDINK